MITQPHHLVSRVALLTICCGTLSGCGAFATIEQTLDTSSDSSLCDPETHTRCIEGDIYWFNSCEQPGALVQYCAIYQTCLEPENGDARCACTAEWTGLACGECTADTDCPGPVGVCTPAGVCTCAAADSNPTAKCQNNTDCSDESYVCVWDYHSGEADTESDFDSDSASDGQLATESSHLVCLRQCFEEGKHGEGLRCEERVPVSGVPTLVWAPPTTCYAYAQHRRAAT